MNKLSVRGVKDTRFIRDIILRNTPDNTCIETKVPGLCFMRFDNPTEPVSYILAPNICMIGQGSKRAFIGDETYFYDKNRMLVSAVHLPIVSQVIDISPSEPYAGLTLELDLNLLTELIAHDSLPKQKLWQSPKPMAVTGISEGVLDAMTRLVQLTESPDHIDILAPLIKRELYFYLLVGEQGPYLRQVITEGSHSHRVAKIANWIKENFAQAFTIEALNKNSGMSMSTFHQHFKALTSMTPLQFQKKIRLNEARKLMLTNQVDAASAAFQVGYESPTQFSREYSRQFGLSPMKDIKRIRESAILLQENE